jgi:tRNA-specific 2-thiouridylase
MSGGVDSSVAALLLKQQGYEVKGVTMNVWEKESDIVSQKACCALDAVNDARAVCNKLGIEYYVLNFRDTFKKDVIDYFVREYIKGKTPNPCIACNRYVKFETLLNKAINVLNCDYIATGHYAKVDSDKNTGRYFLRKSKTITKDQTYALYNLTQEQLKHTLMPLGEYTKEEVRQIAEENELVNAKRHDSQEICFIEDNDYAKFIQEKYNYIPQKGNFVDINGKRIGEHKGIIHYTIGQRKGLGLSLGKYQYVIKIDPIKNEVVIGDEEFLFSDTLICEDLNFMTIDKLSEEKEVTAKIRYSAKDIPATLIPIDQNKVKVIFKEKQRAITPGQSVVFYDQDMVVGGGTIC